MGASYYRCGLWHLQGTRRSQRYSTLLGGAFSPCNYRRRTFPHPGTYWRDTIFNATGLAVSTGGFVSAMQTYKRG